LKYKNKNRQFLYKERKLQHNNITTLKKSHNLAGVIASGALNCIYYAEGKRKPKIIRGEFVIPVVL
jgi:uncharacterized beta-barrel protein YwiB (DUF1934 family)